MHNKLFAMKTTLLLIVSFFVAVLVTATDSPAEQATGKAIFAGGCFWCMESDFEKISGVKEVISGYIGGTGKNPTYKNYSKKGHIEAVEITYDPSVITYEKLLDLFWLQIDPTDANGQFCDRGHEYSTAIFYTTDKQRRQAEHSKATLEKSAQLEKAVVTPIMKDNRFYQAETYHQDYYKKNPFRYKIYRFNCGRDRRLKELWGDKLKHKN